MKSKSDTKKSKKLAATAQQMEKCTQTPGSSTSSDMSESSRSRVGPARIFLSGRATKCHIKGLTQAEESKWSGPFWFMQAADTQLGMIDSYQNKKALPNHDAEIELCNRLIHIANNAKPKPRFLIVCGDLIDAWPRSLRAQQVAEFKKRFDLLDKQIKMICIPGNHDMDDKPTPDTVAEYRFDFGDDYFTFWVGGVKFLAINSQYFINAENVQEHKRGQDEWLDRELAPDNTKPWIHYIGFQHIPPFLEKPDEAPVYVPQTTLPFNYPNAIERDAYIKRLKAGGITYLFCGHYHRNAGGSDDTLKIIVTTAVGCQLGKDRSGFRAAIGIILRNAQNTVEIHYYPDEFYQRILRIN
uniref:Calcineurin-like phosphoesterase domain-containing protein n=1 Tax=Romanomermis culicivorax TaxID=13658 RepID=A0A915KTC8_ROMCU